MIKKLWKHLSKKRRTQFLLLLILMVLASIMEVVSIGAVVPFLSALTSPEIIFEYKFIQPVIVMLGIGLLGNFFMMGLVDYFNFIFDQVAGVGQN